MLCHICSEKKPASTCMTACEDCRREVHEDHREAMAERDTLRQQLSTLTAEIAALRKVVEAGDALRLVGQMFEAGDASPKEYHDAGVAFDAARAAAKESR